MGSGRQYLVTKDSIDAKVIAGVALDGVSVTGVVDGSAAQRSGLQRGLQIRTVRGEHVTAATIQRAIGRAKKRFAVTAAWPGDAEDDVSDEVVDAIPAEDADGGGAVRSEVEEARRRLAAELRAPPRGDTPPAAAATSGLKKGDVVQYAHPRGEMMEATVIRVDMTVHPPSYHIRFEGGEERCTDEEHLTFLRGAPSPPPPVAGSRTEPMGKWFYADKKYYEITADGGDADKLRFAEGGASATAKQGMMYPVMEGDAPEEFAAQWRADLPAGTIWLRHDGVMHSLYQSDTRGGKIFRRTAYASWGALARVGAGAAGQPGRQGARPPARTAAAPDADPPPAKRQRGDAPAGEAPTAEDGGGGDDGDEAAAVLAALQAEWAE